MAENAPANVEAVEAAIEGAFGSPPPKINAPALPPSPPDEVVPEGDAPPEGEPVEAEEGAEPTIPVAEPEFEIEVNGQKEIVKGKEQITELLQKGKHFSRGSEEVARVREVLTAHVLAQQDLQQFQAAIVDDIAQLRSLDEQLNQFSKVDWATAIDSDFVGVMKLQEQRAAVREARNAKLAEIQQKQQYHQQSQAQAAQQLLTAENAALLSKLPEWRNTEKAKAEKATVSQGLVEDYGFRPQELAQLVDHRMVLVARDAMKWRALQRGKDDRIKQVREAPPVSKPGSVTAQQPATSKAGFQKFQQDFRRQGRQGNHNAQNEALEKVLARTFK